MAEPSEKSMSDVVWEIVQWIWGTVQGEFNEEQSVAQIITDATVSMVPVVGEATDVRDIVAVSLRLIKEPDKREEPAEWAMLAVLVCAMIPVVGGVMKGIGRLLLRAAKRGDDIAEVAEQIIELMNRVGWGNAEKRLSEFSFAQYAGPVFKEFTEWINRLCRALDNFIFAYGGFLPRYVLQSVKNLITEFRALRDEARTRWDAAVRYLDDLLAKVKAKIKPDGTGASKAAEHTVPVSAEPTTRAPESKQHDETVSGKAAESLPHPGVDAESLEAKECIAGAKRNFPGFDEEQIVKFCEIPSDQSYMYKWRVWGPSASNAKLRVLSNNAEPIGKYYGIGPAPLCAEDWRRQCAVLSIAN
jgi:hypothetical protein